MFRPVVLTTLALVACACADHSRDYVVRLDLEQIAAQTEARDSAPGFDSIDR